jgi:hypothetical protein
MGLFGGQAYLPQVAVNVFGTDGLQTSVWQLPLSVQFNSIQFKIIPDAA